MSESNPYHPPSHSTEDASQQALDAPGSDAVFRYLWPFIFAANLIVPVLFGMIVTEDHGRVGMFAGVMAFLLAGWVVGVRYPMIGKRLLAGGGIVALTQLLPLVHLIAGLIGIEIVRSLGAMSPINDDDIGGQITNEIGGFICTLVTGAVMISLAVVVGWIVVAVRKFLKPETA